MNTSIKGNFKKIIYSSNGFHVYSFKLFPDQNYQKILLYIDDSTNYINVVSKTNDIDLTLDYEIEINLEIRNNSKYKYNYNIVSKQILVPNEREGVIRFLSSSLFKGISTKTAEKLVNEIGYDFINDCDNHRNKIIKIIGNKKAEIIFEGLENKEEFNEITKEFLKNNFSISILNLIISKTKELKKFLTNSIFSLIDETTSFDFLELDKIARHYLNNYSNELSNEMLILYSIKKIEEEGSTINGTQQIYNFVSLTRLLNIDDYKLALRGLFEKNKIIIHENKITITSTSMYEKEKYIVRRLKALNNTKSDFIIDEKELIIKNLDDVQKTTLINSLSNAFSIITGGPGTGKTLLIDLIIKNLKRLNAKNVEILAPTGKAATQITYKTNEPTKTFHSFLKWNEKTFEINEMNPSEAKIIIIDEFSMINIDLFYALLVGCPKLEQLIIVGDKDQLPPIGPGYLLNDLIQSNLFIVNKLEKIYRQTEGSLIANNSVLIKNSNIPQFDDNESILIDISNYENVKSFIEANIYEQMVSDDIMDHQILIPMYGGNLGIDSINDICQKFINKDKPTLFLLNNKSYFMNDKVIQLENINEKNVFNGEIGQIKNVIFNDKKEIEVIEVEFGLGKKIDYSPSEFNKNIKLAYAISVHKFQGSECSNVVLILDREHISMLTKKLFYTAYTRARKKIWVISNLNLILHCINNDSDSNRKCNIFNLLLNENKI